MANPLRAPRGTTASITARVLLDGELAYNTTTDRLHIGDGVTLGGVAYVPENSEGDVETRLDALETDKAPLASPALTGNPTAPTPSAADNDTSIATTAFVQGEIAAKAPLASPTFTGTPAAPTAAPGTDTTQVATTGFVKAAIDVVLGGVSAAYDTLAEIATAIGLRPRANSASSDPTVTDDSAAGYGIGSLWLNTASRRAFIADSVSASAAAWHALAGAEHPGYIAGNWYAPYHNAATVAGAVLVANAIRLLPFYLPARVTISDIAARITTGAASGNIKLAIYASNPATGRPTGNALVSTGDLSTTSTGMVSSAVTQGNTALNPGFYWMAVWADGTAGGTVALQSVSGAAFVMGWSVGSTTLANVSSGAGVAAMTVSCSKTYGSFPDMTAESFSELANTASGVVLFKAA